MNFDTPLAVPTPEKEQGPKLLSLKEIKVQIARFATHPEISGSEEIIGDSENPYLYQIATLDEKGIGGLYTYRADVDTGDATMEVSYWRGDPANREWDAKLGGGSNLSKYDRAANTWTDVKIDVIDPELLPLRTEARPDDEKKHPERAEPAADAPEAEKQKYFESVFCRASIKSTRVLIGMAQGKGTSDIELLEMIYSSLMDLNKSRSQDDPLAQWNADGNLTQEEFIELRSQYNALPQPLDTIITKQSIRQNQDRKFEDEPKEAGIERLNELFDTAEKILGTIDTEELEARERKSLELALERRNLAKAFADRTMNELLRLNQSYEPFASIKTWNPQGKLREDEFNTLISHRNRLVKAIGSWNAKTGGIRHD